MILLLGSIPLDVRAVGGMSRRRSWNYARHDTIESLPVLQLIARGATDLPLDVRIHPQLGDPTALLAGLGSAADAGEVLPLQTGDGNTLGYFVIEGIDERWSWTTPEGKLLAADLTIKLTEHRAPAAAAPTGLAVEGVAGPERTTPEEVDSSGDPNEVPLSEIVRSG